MARGNGSGPVAAALLAAALLLAACGGGTSAPTEVTLAELVDDHEAFDGDTVTTSGTVRTYHRPRHYWIEDERQHRVELVPEDRVAPHLGEEVRVTGRFTFRDDEGRRIEIDELEVLTEAGAERA